VGVGEMQHPDSKIRISADEEVTREDFAFWIKSMREGLTLSHEEMAEIIGVSPSTVKKYEKGRQLPKDPFLVVNNIRGYIKSRRK
jgi:DNA-binding transcriptional regulator YiaG